MRMEGKSLRLRLSLNAAPALAGLPWEFLHDPHISTYLAQVQRTSIVRFLDVPCPEPVPLVRGPLRVLVVISYPSALTKLDVTAEWERVSDISGGEGRRWWRRRRPTAGSDAA